MPPDFTVTGVVDLLRQVSMASARGHRTRQVSHILR